MNIKNLYLKILYCISLVLTFFPLFVVYIKKGTNGNIVLVCITLLIFYGICCFANPKRFKFFVKRLLHLSTIKAYLCLLLFIILTTLIHICLGTYHAPISYYIVRMYRFFVGSILIYFMPVFGLFIGFKIKSIIKILYLTLYIILIANIIQYFSYILNIGITEQVINLFTNARSALYVYTEGVKINFRVYAFFGEPSALGQMIFIFLPFLFNISFSPYSILKNKYLNFIIKQTTIPFLLAVLIFTKSPIYTLFCLIEFFILLVIKNKLYIKQFILYLIPVLFMFCFVFITFNQQLEVFIENTFLDRLVKSFVNLTNIYTLIDVEPSLASRFISYYIQIVAFTHNIFFGCGLANIDVFINPFFLNIPNVPYTLENIIIYNTVSYTAYVNKSMVYTTLAELGLVGCGFFIIFIATSIHLILKLIKLNTSLNKQVLLSILQSYFAIIFIAFYNLDSQNFLVWLAFGFPLIYIFNFENKK